MKPRASRVVALCSLFGALLSAGAVEAFRLEDSLRGSTRGNVVGGMITADGWRVTDRRDRVWYALPRLVSGYVEFTVSGITMASLTDDSDNELFAMYEAGYGISEPISYGDFRENHYKCMLRVYANGEAGRAGHQKLMWGMCPSGAPGHGTCGCDSFFEEPFGGTAGWDGSPQRMRIEWGSGHTRYFRNGSMVLHIDWSRSGLSFGPQSLHMSLGTSRPSAVGGAQLPVGAVFSNLVVDGTEGPLAVCRNVPTPDAGNPTGSAMVMDFPAVEDVTVAPHVASTVYPDPDDLSVGANDSEFYVKFRVGTLPGRVVRAQLLLNSATIPQAMGTGASVYAAGHSNWSETTLVWNARPGRSGTRLARIDGISVNEPYRFELPAGAVQGAGTYAFGVLPESGDSNSAHFDSKEVSPARGPILRLTVDPTMSPPPVDSGVVVLPTDTGVVVPPTDTGIVDPTDSGVVPPTDTGVVANDLGGTTDTGNGGGGGDSASPPREADAGMTVREYDPRGGCGCHTGARGTNAGAAGALVFVALAARRRRRKGE